MTDGPEEQPSGQPPTTVGPEPDADDATAPDDTPDDGVRPDTA